MDEWSFTTWPHFRPVCATILHHIHPWQRSQFYPIFTWRSLSWTRGCTECSRPALLSKRERVDKRLCWILSALSQVVTVNVGHGGPRGFLLSVPHSHTFHKHLPFSYNERPTCRYSALPWFYFTLTSWLVVRVGERFCWVMWSIGDMITGCHSAAMTVPSSPSLHLRHDLTLSLFLNFTPLPNTTISPRQLGTIWESPVKVPVLDESRKWPIFVTSLWVVLLSGTVKWWNLEPPSTEKICCGYWQIVNKSIWKQSHLLKLFYFITVYEWSIGTVCNEAISSDWLIERS